MDAELPVGNSAFDYYFSPYYVIFPQNSISLSFVCCRFSLDLNSIHFVLGERGRLKVPFFELFLFFRAAMSVRREVGLVTDYNIYLIIIDIF